MILDYGLHSLTAFANTKLLFLKKKKESFIYRYRTIQTDAVLLS